MDAMGMELQEQSRAWVRLWRRRGELAALVAETCPTGPKRVLFTGCGDCHAAAEYGEGFLRWRSDLPVRGLPAMELSRARTHLLGPGTLLIALSVSGRTPRVLEAAALAQSRGATVLGVTDDPHGPLARQVPVTFVLGTAPPEALGRTDYRDPEAARYTGYQRAVPQTKTFGAMQLAVAVACLHLERFAPADRGSARSEVEKQLHSLPRLAADAEKGGTRAAAHLAERGRPRRRVTFCASGLNASTARYCSYKLLELSCPAAFSDIEEFCHTQYLVTESGDAVVFLVQDRACLERALEIVPVLKEDIGAVVAVLGTIPCGNLSGGFGFPAGEVLPEVSPLVLGCAGAHLVRHLAASWGFDTDRFRAGIEEERYVRGSTRIIRDSKTWGD
ncbi:MAG: SIS domain-containing protein [Proteobacteria bacterium]|nr:SIS domain-containing protein [Pseudomonadota bacterium]